MKKLTVALGLMVVVTAAAVSFAEEPRDMKEDMGPAGGGMMEDGMKGGGMMGGHKGMMGKMGGHGMMCPLCSSMMERQVVATGDGGFVVIQGSKATKYDKDLKVVKEVELKFDADVMMQQMKDCPMCKMMKEKMGEKKDMMMEHPRETMEQKQEAK